MAVVTGRKKEEEGDGLYCFVMWHVPIRIASPTTHVQLIF